MSRHSAPASSLSALRDGNLQDIVNRGSLHDFLVGLHQDFGPVASFWFGRQPVVSLGDLQQLQQHINPNHTSESFISSTVPLVPLIPRVPPQLFLLLSRLLRDHAQVAAGLSVRAGGRSHRGGPEEEGLPGCH